jgi:hypothetical protein
MPKKKNPHVFSDMCRQMLLALGAQPGQSYELRLETLAGPMECTPYDEWLACRFDDPARARAIASGASLNPHSGKWNWHYTKPGLPEALDLFSRIAAVVRMPEPLEALDFEPQPTGASMLTTGNTRLDYMYRDGSNNKCDASVVFSGAGYYERQHLSALVHACDLSNGNVAFIPGMVGLGDLQDSFKGGASHWDPEGDHPWHEITGITATAEKPTTTVEWPAFVEKVLTTRLTSGWNEDYKPPFYAEMASRYERYLRASETMGTN